MIGTTFLYMYWPSFNAALGTFSSQQQRSIINTLLANSTSCITACIFSRITRKHLDMLVVVNATLAGGVAMGSSADLINFPFCAMIVGFVAGMVSCFGYVWLATYFRKIFRYHDTQGVLWTHGLPGIIGGFVSAISCDLAEKNFGDRYS